MVTLEIDSRRILETLDIEQDILMLFQQRDLNIDEKKVFFESSILTIKERILILNGFKPTHLFNEKKENILTNYLKNNFEGLEYLKNDEYYLSLSNYSYEDYLKAIRSIVCNRKPEDSFLVNFLTKNEFLVDINKIPGCNDESGLLFFMDMLTDAFEEDKKIRYDITQIAEFRSIQLIKPLESLKNEGVDINLKNKDIFRLMSSVSHYIEETKNDLKPRIGEKTIVLTEGVNDSNILDRCLNLLFPEICEYFYFMDFKSSKSQGSAGELVNKVKSFKGAGIKNKIIAIFDNDSAAYDAVRSLEKVELPKNIKISHYPNIPLFRSYPTIGPTGKLDMDISGLACSIEMYFGVDVLNIGENLMPIQWKGYMSGLKKYQGEILDKKLIQKRFFEKLKSCEQDKSLINKFDWVGIKSILESIVNSFIE